VRFVYALSEGIPVSAREFPCDERLGSWIIAGRLFIEKPLLLELLFWLDLPSLAPGALFLKYAVAPYVCVTTHAWFITAAWIIGGSVQWLITGWLIERLLWRSRVYK